MSTLSNLEPVELLLAEDNATDAEMTIRALKRVNLANHLIWVKDGEEALEFLRREGRYAGRADGQPKVVLLDLKMPKMDGLDVLREIREDARLRSQPVVVLTSSREEADLVASYELGVNSYIVKPVDFQQLLEEVARLGYYWLMLNRRPAGGD
jgi:CheY-like chemotaxis protein